MKSLLWILFLLLSASSRAFAFHGHQVQESGLLLRIEELPRITQYDVPVAVRVFLENTSDAPVSGTVTVKDLVDEWRVKGKPSRHFQLSQGASCELHFSILVGKGALSALYPIHAYASFKKELEQFSVHAVRVVQAEFPEADRTHDVAPQLRPIVIPDQGSLSLLRSKFFRVAWRYENQPLRYKSVGWDGRDAQSDAMFWTSSAVERGGTRTAIAMHPPYRGGTGSVFCDYQLRLPKITPLVLDYANAIRTHHGTEPPSDGVTFRVWAITGETEHLLDEHHTDSKVWVPRQADLTRFAGQEIVLRLESHPGADLNTVCDLSYWADVCVTAGAADLLPSETAPFSERAEAISEEAVRTARSTSGTATESGILKKQESTNRFSFAANAKDGLIVFVIEPGQRGLLDGCLAVAAPNGASVVFNGLQIVVGDQPLQQGLSDVLLKAFNLRRSASRLVADHLLRDPQGDFRLKIVLWLEGGGLRLRTECSRHISDIALGQTNGAAKKVYWGHGYCLVEPEPFSMSFGGHTLSTSHVGFDFESGLSVLQAFDNPPTRLDVSTREGIHALHSTGNATLTLVAGVHGAMNCALQYRNLYDRAAASRVINLAGRVGFDFWGGHYADIEQEMKRMAQYGCTDAVLTIHNWQRWGYDYRLPDVFPPNPRMGTLEEIQRLGKTCREIGILWGLHDNYIDFYPDATGYTYDQITFTRHGAPVKAWLNEGMDAQSYQFRPDRIMPYVKRNLRLVKKHLQPTHYFLDVFASIGPFEYYDRSGKFHSNVETRDCHGQAFAWIRKCLGDNAPTTSEAGHDQLTGWLDGSDCQFLRITPQAERFGLHLPCQDWERVPWFDAVLHDKLILHGVGYSDRFQANLSRREHGITSDDYISAEVLTGHPMMTDVGCIGAQAVRKYWLLHGIGRDLAMQRIERVEFADQDIHRQTILWGNGTTVWVNRSQQDWIVEGHVLPPCGYYVRGNNVEGAVERIGDVVVERSIGADGWFFNSRNSKDPNALAITPAVESFEYIGQRQFKLTLKWDVQQIVPAGLIPFVHFLPQGGSRTGKIAFQGDHKPEISTEKWTGVVLSGQNRIIQVPSAIEETCFDVAVGLFKPGINVRYSLNGEEVENCAYRVGVLHLDIKNQEINVIRFEPTPAPQATQERDERSPNASVDFGTVITDGALRITPQQDRFVVTPLPDSPPFSADFHLASILSSEVPENVLVETKDMEGRTLHAEMTPVSNGRLSVHHQGGQVQYQVSRVD
ncbi:MAG TPA: hypothetical protein PKH07_00450 [bacterium]|nr:hypothetical protein [bacterium]